MASFRGVVEDAARGGHVIGVADAVAAEVGARYMLRVRGTLEDAPYRSNPVKLGGRLILAVHKATLEAASRTTGDELLVTIEADTEAL